MGMVMTLHTISDDNIARVLADPPLVWRVIAADNPETYERAHAEKRPGFIARLFGAASDRIPAQVPDLSKVDGEGIETDLDKSWHGIHYLLTGTAWEGTEPIDFIVRGGTEVGQIDVGYGPARVFTSDHVAGIATVLGDLDESTLRKRFNPEEMMKLDIYPQIWNRASDDDDVLGYCLEYAANLRRFLSHAVSNSMGMVLHLS